MEAQKVLSHHLLVVIVHDQAKRTTMNDESNISLSIHNIFFPTPLHPNEFNLLMKNSFPCYKQKNVGYHLLGFIISAKFCTSATNWVFPSSTASLAWGIIAAAVVQPADFLCTHCNLLPLAWMCFSLHESIAWDWELIQHYLPSSDKGPPSSNATSSILLQKQPFFLLKLLPHPISLLVVVCILLLAHHQFCDHIQAKIHRFTVFHTFSPLMFGLVG